MENNIEKEFYEDNSNDVVESFDQLNEKYRNSDWIQDSNFKGEDEGKVNENAPDPVEAFKKLLLPSDAALKDMTSVYEYQQRETDPYQRILNLKHELIETKGKIDDYVGRFQDNTFIKETDNFSKVLEELDLYKSKIDAFINYDVFNKLGDMNDEDEDDEGSQSQSNKSGAKSEFYSIFEKYNRITENLISQIKIAENEVINKNSTEVNIKYEIYANPEMEMENLMSRITELEDLVTNLERTIGNWSIYNNNESISLTLNKLFNFTTSKMNEKYDKKYQTFKECGSLITHFLDKKKEKLETGSYFLKIKELYAVLELYEHFDQIFDYIKKRLKAIKEIYDNSDQFNIMLNNLTNAITKNEERFQKLLKDYEETLQLFFEFEAVFKEIEEIDNSFKKILV